MIRAVLFDATGTLIELRESVGESYARVARDFGAELSAERVDAAFGRAFAAAEPLVFPDAAPTEVPHLEREWWRRRVHETFLAADPAQRPNDLDGCFERLWTEFTSPNAWRARPGARELSSRLRAEGLRSGVVSNFDHRLPDILKGLGLEFEPGTVVLPAAAGAAKPDARIFALACRRLGVTPAEALFVGDDEQRDLAGARGAGLCAVDARSLATLDALQFPSEAER